MEWTLAFLARCQNSWGCPSYPLVPLANWKINFEGPHILKKNKTELTKEKATTINNQGKSFQFLVDRQIKWKLHKKLGNISEQKLRIHLLSCINSVSQGQGAAKYSVSIRDCSLIEKVNVLFYFGIFNLFLLLTLLSLATVVQNTRRGCLRVLNFAWAPN